MPNDFRRVLSSLRLGDIYPMTRRVTGLSYLDREDFLPQVGAETAERLRDIALHARGDGPAPILVFGVMPRSGTNFLRDVLALHPDVCADPGRLYEFPLLHAARSATSFMDQFLSYFPRNAEVLDRLDALALLSGAWLRELQREAGERQILLKSPHVQNIGLLTTIFPGAKCVLCLRDGRDVLDSSLKTFGSSSLGRKNFKQLAWEWKLGTEAILTFDEGGVNQHPDVMVLHYERLIDDQDTVIEALLSHTGLDPVRYDREALAALPVRGSSRSEKTSDSRWQPQARDASFKPVGRWADWSEGRKARFDRIAGEVLERAGYVRAA
ncbi:sulfotransferase family protein [Amaricoccus macauensis]|uniref:sulfotransferase family protein n=1 Tax=Amaricoccus macauensis TaxID=57001 RepID=UPI003C7A7619